MAVEKSEKPSVELYRRYIQMLLTERAQRSNLGAGAESLRCVNIPNLQRGMREIRDA